MGHRHIALAVCVLLGIPLGIPALPAEASAQETAQIFATSNTAVITDPGDPRLRTRLVRFERRVRGIIRANGADPGASTLLDGVFWSSSLRRATYERSREFDVTRVSASGLHHIADVIRKTYAQESVLTFRYLPRSRADAVEVEAPGVDVRHLHDALAADPAARDRLGGGSIARVDSGAHLLRSLRGPLVPRGPLRSLIRFVPNGRLILVVALRDLALARRLVAEAGGAWTSVTMRYGDEEFVAAPPASGH